MRRGVVAGGVLAIGAMSIGIGAYQQPPAQRAPALELEKVKENLFVIRGGGGNTAVFVQSAGVTIVDTKNPGMGAPILAKIKEVTDKPVTTIVNTHTHGDHVSGNVEFPATVDVVTHENTAANMKRMASPPGFPAPAKPQPNIFTASEGRGLPKQTFTDHLTLGTGADQVDLYYFGRAHTDGDAMVVFPAIRAMHMGDVFPGKQIPIMDSNNGGSGVAYPDTLEKAHQGVQNVDAIITGHSTVMTAEDLGEYASFIRDFVEAVRAGKKAGRNADEIASSWSVPSKYAGYSGGQATRLKANVELIMKELP